MTNIYNLLYFLNQTYGILSLDILEKYLQLQNMFRLAPFDQCACIKINKTRGISDQSVNDIACQFKLDVWPYIIFQYFYGGGTCPVISFEISYSSTPRHCLPSDNTFSVSEYIPNRSQRIIKKNVYIRPMSHLNETVYRVPKQSFWK